MTRHMPIALFCAAAWTAPAAAQDIYRCGDSYSQQACAGGRLVAASDSRSAAQKAQTDQATERAAKAGDAMQKARLIEEAKPVPVGMPLPKAQEPLAPPTQHFVSTKSKEKAKTQTKAKKPERFSAVAPKGPDEVTTKKKKKPAKKDA